MYVMENLQYSESGENKGGGIWKILGIVFFVALLLAAGSTYFYSKTKSNNLKTAKYHLPTDHLIPNVPYRGQYIGSWLSNQESTGVQTILYYWGDENLLTDKNLLEIFEPDYNEFLGYITAAYTKDFFEEVGYKVELTTEVDETDFKNFLANNIPLYVNQRLSLDSTSTLRSNRIYIGYSDTNNNYVVHDNNFGNNYTISYEEFKALNQDGISILIIHPPDYSVSSQPRLTSANPDEYPDRLSIMNDSELRELQIKLMLVNYYKKRAVVEKINGVKESVALLEEIVSSPAFDKLHPAARMSISYNLSGFYMGELNEPEKAISLLVNTTIPLVESHDFSKPFGEWDRKMPVEVYESPFWDSAPWSRLGYLYLKTDQPKKATESFLKSLEYHPDYQEAIDGLAEAEKF